MAYGIIEQGWSGLDPRLKAFTSLARVRLAINFGDFAGQRSVKNQAGPEYGYLQGTAKITPEGLVVDGSSNCNLVIPSAFGVSNSSSSMIIVGATLPSGNQSGALIKVGEGSDGIGLGVGSGTMDSDGANCIGLLEAVAWVPSTTPCTNGYHTFAYLHYQALGDRAAISVDGTIGVAGSVMGSMVAATSSTYIGGYGTRMAAATIHWVAIVEGAPGSTKIFDDLYELAPKIWPAHGFGWKKAAENDPVFYTLAGGGANTTGTLSSTLDNTTLAGIGGVATSGILAVTLDAATLTGIGAVTTNGTLNSTLEDATLSGAGTVAVGTNREGTLAVTLDAAALAGIGAVTRSGTLAVTLDNATLVGIGTAGQAVTGTLAVTLDNVTLSGIGAIPATPSQGGGTGTGRNLSRKQKKKLKAVESQEWLKAEETARQLLSDRFTKQTPKEKAEALQTYVESLQPVIEALKALTTQIEEVKEVVEDAPIIELTPHQEILSRFDILEKKLKSVEELVIILMADL